MKIFSLTQHIGTVALVLGLAVGCASTQEQQTTETTEGPTESEVRSQIEQARSTNQDARAMGADWRSARKLINEAESALEAGNNAQAMNLAIEAEKTAEQNIEDYKSEQDQMADESSAEGSGSSMDAAKMRSHTVERGDTLWGISASSTGYNDPYQWPLIFKANKSRIDDPDLIHPGQTFQIKANPSPKQVDMAVDHAKNRGAWSLGQMESSDEQYLDMSGGM